MVAGRKIITDMEREPLDIYDDFPRAMRKYLQHNGWHFGKKACDIAVSLMEKKNEATGKKEKIEAWTKDQVDNLLKTHGVVVGNNVGYDYIYIANMCKADYLGSSITDEQHVALYIKDTIDDIDVADGAVMRCWYAKMVGAGIPVEWEDML